MAAGFGDFADEEPPQEQEFSQPPEQNNPFDPNNDVNQPPAFQGFQQPAQPQNSKDLDLVLTKLELINQKLEVLDRRLQVIEKIAKESQ